MGSTSKLLKHSEGSEDRLTNLPNSVIGHILSLLPTKYAVGTTILSTKWTDLWTSSLDNLDFDDRLLLNLQNRYSDPAMQASFTNFVNRVILLGTQSHWRRFSLKCKGRYKKANTNAWVSAALSHNVRELYIAIRAKRTGLLPDELFISRNLEALKLAIRGPYDLEIPPMVRLENLKILHLHKINFEDDSINRLISGCYVLEELEIFFCGVGRNKLLNITAPLLRRLALKNICTNAGWYGENLVDIVSNTPRLVSLDYIDNYGMSSVSVKNLESLVKANIEYGCVDRMEYDGSVVELLQGITKVKILKLSGSTMQAHGLYDVPVFLNLTHLMLGPSLFYYWRLLPSLLGSTPILERLDLYDGILYYESPYDYSSDEYHDDDDDEEPSCYSSSLSEITISSFKGKKEEQKWVEYLLKKGMVLKLLEIKSAIGDKMEKLKVTEELLKLPRASVNCRVVVL